MEFVHDEDKERLKGLIERSLQGEEGLEAVFRIFDSDNIIKYLRTQWRLILDEKQIPQRLAGTVQDVTTGKESENLLKAKNAELEKTNGELDRFVYSASHDLRSPLTSLLGLISLMENEKPAPRQQEYIDMMRTSVERLDHLIHNIVDYSRNSRLSIQTDKIDFSSEIKACLQSLQFLEGFENIDISIQVQNDAPYYGDKNRLFVLLNNLISNAIKYYNRQQAHPYIRIDVIQSATGAIFSIEDNGTGIAQEHQDKIFDMFYRASDASEGSGLGLYIVKETLEKLNGKIHIQSAAGKGSKFTVEIPNAVPE